MVPVRSGTLSQSGNFPLCRHSLSCGWCWNSHAADSPKPQMKTANKNDKTDLKKQLSPGGEGEFGTFGKGP